MASLKEHDLPLTLNQLTPVILGAVGLMGGSLLHAGQTRPA